MIDLDNTDRQILSILVRSGREPLKRLASSIGLSRSAMTARLRRLEGEGLIEGYTAILSSEILPRPNRAVLMVRVSKTPAYNIVEEFKRITEVVQCRSVSGETDIILDLAAETVELLNRARDKISAVVGVTDVTTHMVLSTNFSTRPM